MNPLILAVALGGQLDELGIKYAVGGSVASSFYGEPRSTLDIDVAVQGDTKTLRQLLDDVAADFYVPLSSAETAIETRDSFNLLHHETGMKVDVFVLGDDVLDLRQIERRVRIAVAEGELWVTAPEDIVLRKLWWYSKTNRSSTRQWADVVKLLETYPIDRADLLAVADEVGLRELANQAFVEAGLG